MRLWNLSEFPAPELSVVQSYPNRPKRQRARLHPSRFKIVVTVAALAAGFSVPVIQVNAASVRVPLAAVSVAQSVPEPRAPLAEFFKGQYSSDWTEDLENELLMRVESNRLQGVASSLVEQTIDAVVSNQFEELSDPANTVVSNRMSREEIAALVKLRKLV